MIDEELEKLLKGTGNVNVDEFMDGILNSQENPGNRIDPDSYKESSKEKKSDDDVEEESTKKGERELMLIAQDAPLSSDKEKLKELTVIDPTPSSSTPSSSSPKPKTG
ncbi:hypothetical protein Tco_1053005 [Tanacetum coccineum]